MAIVLAFKNGEVDWPTTRTALVNFPYVSDSKPKPEYGTPEYAEWYSRDDGLAAAKAKYSGKFEHDRFEEVAEALRAKYPKNHGAPTVKP